MRLAQWPNHTNRPFHATIVRRLGQALHPSGASAAGIASRQESGVEFDTASSLSTVDNHRTESVQSYTHQEKGEI